MNKEEYFERLEEMINSAQNCLSDIKSFLREEYNEVSIEDLKGVNEND